MPAKSVFNGNCIKDLASIILSPTIGSLMLMGFLPIFLLQLLTNCFTLSCNILKSNICLKHGSI